MYPRREPSTSFEPIPFSCGPFVERRISNLLQFCFYLSYESRLQVVTRVHEGLFWVNCSQQITVFDLSRMTFIDERLGCPGRDFYGLALQSKAVYNKERDVMNGANPSHSCEYAGSICTLAKTGWKILHSHRVNKVLLTSLATVHSSMSNETSSEVMVSKERADPWCATRL